MKKLSQEYITLFNGVSGVISELETTLAELKNLQQKTEEMYIEVDEAC